MEGKKKEKRFFILKFLWFSSPYASQLMLPFLCYYWSCTLVSCSCVRRYFQQRLENVFLVRGEVAKKTNEQTSPKKWMMLKWKQMSFMFPSCMVYDVPITNCPFAISLYDIRTCRYVLPAWQCKNVFCLINQLRMLIIVPSDRWTFLK